MTWILFWKIVLILALALFAVMAVLVAIFGALDIGKLLRALRHLEDETPEE